MADVVAAADTEVATGGDQQMIVVTTTTAVVVTMAAMTAAVTDTSAVMTVITSDVKSDVTTTRETTDGTILGLRAVQKSRPETRAPPGARARQPSRRVTLEAVLLCAASLDVP